MKVTIQSTLYCTHACMLPGIEQLLVLKCGIIVMILTVEVLI